MQEEKRKILTKEGVRLERLRLLKGELIFIVLTLVFIESVMIALTVGAHHMAPHMWMLFGFLLLLDALLTTLFLWKFILPTIKELRYISQGKFSIVEDKLVGVGEDEVIRSRGRHRYYTVDMLYFEACGHIPEDKGVRGYGPCGSTFYLLVLDDPDHTVYTFYSSQLYAYQSKDDR